MTPVERLQAAIDKLEQLRAEAYEGPWELRQGRRWRVLDKYAVGVLVGAKPNAELIVTLHRTIDAQLELLRSALKFVGETRGAASHEGPAFTLADAILGGA